MGIFCRRTAHGYRCRGRSSVVASDRLGHFEEESVDESRHDEFSEQHQQHQRKFAPCEKVVVLRDEEECDEADKNYKAENGVENGRALSVDAELSAVLARSALGIHFASHTLSVRIEALFAAAGASVDTHNLSFH